MSLLPNVIVRGLEFWYIPYTLSYIGIPDFLMLKPALLEIIMDNAFVNIRENGLILGDTFRCHANNFFW